MSENAEFLKDALAYERKRYFGKTWEQVLEENEYFDGETEIEASAKATWRRVNEQTFPILDLPKPRVKLTGTDGNVFALAGVVTRALKQAGQRDKAAEFQEKLWKCGSYNEALALMGEYCEVS